MLLRRLLRMRATPPLASVAAVVRRIGERAGRADAAIAAPLAEATLQIVLVFLADHFAAVGTGIGGEFPGRVQLGRQRSPCSSTRPSVSRMISSRRLRAALPLFSGDGRSRDVGQRQVNG